MGGVVCFFCNQCKFKYEHHTGVGMLLFATQCQSREMMRSGKWGEKWQKMLAENPEGTATLDKVLCYCRRCSRYYSKSRIVFWIPKENYHFDFKENYEDMVPTYIIHKYYRVLEKESIVCSKCNEEVEVIEEYSKATCPMCGKNMKYKSAGIYD